MNAVKGNKSNLMILIIDIGCLCPPLHHATLWLHSAGSLAFLFLSPHTLCSTLAFCSSHLAVHISRQLTRSVFVFPWSGLTSITWEGKSSQIDRAIRVHHGFGLSNPIWVLKASFRSFIHFLFPMVSESDGFPCLPAPNPSTSPSFSPFTLEGHPA